MLRVSILRLLGLGVSLKRPDFDILVWIVSAYNVRCDDDQLACKIDGLTRRWSCRNRDGSVGQLGLKLVDSEKHAKE